MGGPWNFLVTSLMDPEDDFRQRLRKSVVGLFFCPIGMVVLGYAIRGYFTYRVASQIAAGVAQNLISLVCFASYGFLRSRRHVTDRHIAAVQWLFAGLCTVVFLAMPEFDCKSIIFANASMGIMTQMPTLPMYLVFCGAQLIVADWNKSVEPLGSGSMWTLPDPRVGTTSSTRLIGYFAGSVALMGCIYMFYLQIVESERRGKAQMAANKMTLRVLQRQRKYDTEEVSKILEECTAEGIVDNELIELFEEMNSNLESYRPFLPNYLFQDDDDEDEKDPDDEGDLIIDGRSVSPAPAGVNDDASEGCISIYDEVSEAHSAGRKFSSGANNKRQFRPSGIGKHVTKIPADAGSLSSRSPRSSSGLPVADVPHSGLNKLRSGSLFVGRITFAMVDICVNRLALVGGRGFDSQEILSSVVNCIYNMAKETKASVHSMLGDTVQLTWNATSNVALPETKGAVFLDRLAKRLQEPQFQLQAKTINNNNVAPQVASSHYSPATLALNDSNGALNNSCSGGGGGGAGPLCLSGAVCSGMASVHTITSSHQQALIIEAPWLPMLEGCFDLAKQNAAEYWARLGGGQGGRCGNQHQHSQNHLLMDEGTMKASAMEVNSCPVEQVSYVPSHTEPSSTDFEDLSLDGSNTTGTKRNLRPHPHPKFAFVCHSPQSTAPPPQKNCTTTVTSTLSSPSTSSVVSSLVYEILGEKVRGDDEWMYQLQQGEDPKNEENKRTGLQLKALTATAEGRFGDALSFFEEAADMSASGTTNAATATNHNNQGGATCATGCSSPFFVENLVRHCQSKMMAFPQHPSQ